MNSVSVRLKLGLLAVALAASTGCTDGPFFHMKKLNPWIQAQWKKDRQSIVVPSQRVAEIQLLRRQIASMSEADQAKWVGQMKSMLATETSPVIKRESILTLEKVAQRSDAIEVILSLAKDKNDTVRLASVDALRDHPTPETTAALLAMAQSDSSNQIRLAATESLGKHDTQDVRNFLVKKLEDRSPAAQQHATLALKTMTGKDYKGDVESWKRFMEGESVPEPTPSMAEAFQSMFTTKR